jgi:hypothetical protein
MPIMHKMMCNLCKAIVCPPSQWTIIIKPSSKHHKKERHLNLAGGQVLHGRPIHGLDTPTKFSLGGCLPIIPHGRGPHICMGW